MISNLNRNVEPARCNMSIALGGFSCGARPCARGLWTSAWHRLAAGLAVLAASWSGHLWAASAPVWPVVAASASANDGNVPANAVDGSLATRWSAQGDGQWIRFDLGASRLVGSISIAWHQGDT